MPGECLCGHCPTEYGGGVKRSVEHIIVDDGSSDHSLRVATEFAKSHPYVRVISFDHNRGTNAARNAGIKAAKGKWCAVLYSDDHFKESALEEIDSGFSNKTNPYITVLTPAYNKGKTIRRTYESLLNQTCFDFEWLIINDGSTDQTDEIVKSFHTDKFSIRYISKENEGLCHTYNQGVRMAAGELLYRLDPDDSLSPDAIELVLKYRHLLDDKDICALVFLAQFDNGEVVGYHPYKDKCHRSNFAKYRLKDNATGDRAEVVKTEALREFPWPIFGDEKFCLETLFWHPMAHKYDAYYINEPTYIREYNQNSITAAGSQTYINNPIGTMAVTSYMVREYIEYDDKWSVPVFKNAINYWRYGLHAKNTQKDKYISLPAFWAVVACLPGWMLYMIDSINPTVINKFTKYIKRLRNKDNFSNLTIKKV